MKIPLTLACALVACAQPPSVSAYEAQQRACVADAGTREAADECRCAVKAKFGNPCDAGSDR